MDVYGKVGGTLELLSQSISIRGLKIHFRVAQPQGLPRHRVFLVCAPGFLLSSWRHVLPELNKAGCLCVVCESPGFGFGAWNKEIPIDQPTRARYLWGVLDDLDLFGGERLNKWHLMAHGASCGTIAQMALQVPDSTASLFLVNPTLYNPFKPYEKALLKTPFRTLAARVWTSRHITDPHGFDQLLFSLYQDVPSRAQRERMRMLMTRLVGHEDTLVKLVNDGLESDLSGLKSLFLPGMVIWGGRDKLLGGEQAARLLKRDFPDAESHTLPQAGHCAMETHAAEVCDFLRGWIRELWN